MSVKRVKVVERSQRDTLPFPLLTCESWMLAKENPVRKKNKLIVINQFICLLIILISKFFKSQITSDQFESHDHIDHLRDVPWEDIFKLGASVAVSEFSEWVQVGIDVYIPHRKYQVKPHSSLSFLAACAAALVHRSCGSKVRFRQA